MKLDQIFPIDELDKAITAGYVAVREKDDDPDLVIANYTKQTQYERVWNDITINCRGLAYRVSTGEVEARPFKKFFNLGEMETLPEGPYRVFEKMDGSLGIGYIDSNGDPGIATRGSFDSDQAKWATKWLHAHPDLLESVGDWVAGGITPLFEIIYPENRIVVSYGSREDLVLLALIDMETGLDIETPIHETDWTGSFATSWGGLDLDTLVDGPHNGQEGYVILWSDGTRAKVKYDEYMRLHRIITGVTERTIWEMLSNRMGLERLVELVPDEFYQWMKEVEHKLNERFSKIEKSCLKVYSQVNLADDRKDQAAFILRYPNSDIIFAMLDQKPYADKIWRQLDPGPVKRTYDDDGDE